MKPWPNFKASLRLNPATGPTARDPYSLFLTHPYWVPNSSIQSPWRAGAQTTRPFTAEESLAAAPSGLEFMWPHFIRPLFRAAGGGEAGKSPHSCTRTKTLGTCGLDCRLVLFRTHGPQRNHEPGRAAQPVAAVVPLSWPYWPLQPGSDCRPTAANNATARSRRQRAHAGPGALHTATNGEARVVVEWEAAPRSPIAPTRGCTLVNGLSPGLHGIQTRPLSGPENALLPAGASQADGAACLYAPPSVLLSYAEAEGEAIRRADGRARTAGHKAIPAARYGCMESRHRRFHGTARMQFNLWLH